MFVHSSRIKKQIEYMQSLGVNTNPVYELAEIRKEEVLDPEKMFSFEQFHTVLEYALNQTGDEFYGLRMGQDQHLAGTVGMMAASTKNLKEAFQQGCKFFGLQGNFAEITFVEDNHFSKIEYHITNAWQMKYPDTARHEVDAMFSFLSLILKINSNNTVKPHRINLKTKKPKNSDPYFEVFGSFPFFESEKNEMFLRNSDLQIPMKAFNPETLNLLKAHAEAQLKKINQQETVVEKVKTLLLNSMQYQFPDIETVASKLNISARTLQRQLLKENSSFKNIVMETRFDLARKLLRQNVLTISEIGYTLGYSDLANFSRSFKKFTGRSPQEFRNLGFR